MTAEELNAKYTQASWLIAKHSASAAGKALLFSSQSLEEASREIAAIYNLSEEEIARLQPREDSGAVANIQKTANTLLGSGNDPVAGQAVKVARTAIQNGRAAAMISGLLKAGPKAAQAAASGGSIASKGTPWGWIATATYAAGTAGWFAYNARAFNLEAFELVREREGIELAAKPPEPEPAADGPMETMTLKIELPTIGALTSQAGKLGSKAQGMFSGAFAGLRRSKS